MSASWKYERWETPVSDEEFLSLGLQYDDWILHIRLDPSTDARKKPGVVITFERCAAFRNVVEQFRNELWNRFAEAGHPGRTFTIQNSPWIAELSEAEPTFPILEKNIKHYVIATDLDVIEILTSREPTVTAVDKSATVTEPVASSPGLPILHPASLIATGFGLGRLPVAPGTWASLAALPLAWLLDDFAGIAGIAIAGIVLTLIGIWASQAYVAHQRAQDPGEIVIDEIAAQLLVLTVVPLSLFSMALGFALFRLFDIVKPWPVSWADRSVKGGLGVMLDDLLAAAYAALSVKLVMLFTGHLHVS